MARSKHTNQKSRTITDDERAQIYLLHGQGMPPKDIAAKLNIPNPQQVTGMLNFSGKQSSVAANDIKQKVIAKFAAKQEAKQAAVQAAIDGNVQPPMGRAEVQLPPRNQVVDNPLMGGGARIIDMGALAQQIAPVTAPPVNQGMRKPGAMGRVLVWRRELTGWTYIGQIGWPYKVSELAEKCGDGQYQYEVWNPGASMGDKCEETIVGNGPARYPNPIGDAMYQQAPQQAPQQQSVADSIRAVGEVAEVINRTKAPSLAEKAGEKLMEAVLENVTNPPKPVPPPPGPQPLTMDDLARWNMEQDKAHQRRMEEMTTKANAALTEAQAAATRIAAEADARAKTATADAEAKAKAEIAKIEADSKARIAEAEAKVKIRETELQATHLREQERERKWYEREKKELEAVIKSNGDAIKEQKAELVAELAKDRKRDEDVMAERNKAVTADSAAKLLVANAQVEAIQAKGAAGDDWFFKGMREFKPILQDLITAAKEKAALDNSPGVLNNALKNQQVVNALAGNATAAPPAAQPSGAATPPPAGGIVERVMQNQIDEALSSPAFKQFLGEYCLDFTDALERDSVRPDPNGIFRQLSSNMFTPGPNTPTWMNVGTFIKRRRWAAMQAVLWPHLTPAQQQLLAGPSHEYFYEKFRAKLWLALTDDTDIWERQKQEAEAMRAAAPVMHTPSVAAVPVPAAQEPAAPVQTAAAAVPAAK